MPLKWSFGLSYKFPAFKDILYLYKYSAFTSL